MIPQIVQLVFERCAITCLSNLNYDFSPVEKKKAKKSNGLELKEGFNLLTRVLDGCLFVQNAYPNCMHSKKKK